MNMGVLTSREKPQEELCHDQTHASSQSQVQTYVCDIVEVVVVVVVVVVVLVVLILVDDDDGSGGAAVGGWWLLVATEVFKNVVNIIRAWSSLTGTSARRAQISKATKVKRKNTNSHDIKKRRF
jgi:hypothetical protein